MKPIKIYISGPYSKGDTIVNIATAILIAERLIIHGFHPKVPHLSGFWHFLAPHSHEFWLEYDKIELLECDAVYRIRGKSKGADMEEQFAIDNNIPVFRSVDLLILHFYK